MNILRLSTLSLSLAIAIFALGYVNPSFAAPPDKPCSPWPSCKDDGGGGGGGDDATYNVVIVGDDLAGDGIDSPPWHDGGRKNSISGGEQHNTGFFRDLSIFESIFNTMVGDPPSTQGAVCFPPDTVFVIEGATIGQKKGRAEAAFWFQANTFEGGQTLFYQLYFTGDINGPWLPGTGESAQLTMTDWRLTATNEGQDIKSISCIGEGSIGGGAGIQFVFITVTNLT